MLLFFGLLLSSTTTLLALFHIAEAAGGKRLNFLTGREKERQSGPVFLLLALAGIFVVSRFPTLAPIPAFVIISWKLIKKRTGRERVRKVKRLLPFFSLSLALMIESGASVPSAVLQLVQSIPEGEGKNFLLMINNALNMGENGRSVRESINSTYRDESILVVAETLLSSGTSGASPSRVLREMSEKLLEERVMDAEERAMKAPVKLMLPLCFFIFPAIFLLIFSPIFSRIGGF